MYLYLFIYMPVRDRRGRPTYLGYGKLGIPSVGKNEGNGQRTKKKVKF
jgi:hypothetical protein